MIVPSATAPGEIVVNGMSMSRRDSEFANSGIVTAIEDEDLKDYEQYGALSRTGISERNLKENSFEAEMVHRKLLHKE